MRKRRLERLSDLLKEELSRILFQKMQDARLSLCSITNIVLSNDYRHAKVYVSVIGTIHHREECLKALNSAGGFFRHELGGLSLRYVRSLNFYFDTGAECSQHIEELLKAAIKEESEP